jgi:hypothetical protein
MALPSNARSLIESALLLTQMSEKQNSAKVLKDFGGVVMLEMPLMSSSS